MDKIGQDLPGEDLGQPRIIKGAHPMEDARFPPPPLRLASDGDRLK